MSFTYDDTLCQNFLIQDLMGFDYLDNLGLYLQIIDYHLHYLFPNILRYHMIISPTLGTRH
jgi:hypothetical protein